MKLNQPDRSLQCKLVTSRLRTNGSRRSANHGEKRQDRYTYSLIDGDPLDLKNTILRLKHLDKIDAHGFIHEKAWWMAKKEHVYPDPLRRIWEGMNDLVQHPATVLVSLKDGYARDKDCRVCRPTNFRKTG